MRLSPVSSGELNVLLQCLARPPRQAGGRRRGRRSLPRRCGGRAGGDRRVARPGTEPATCGRAQAGASPSAHTLNPQTFLERNWDARGGGGEGISVPPKDTTSESA